MNQQIKQDWLTALCSGKYQQTNGSLKDDSGFCCLGVLADLYVKSQVNPNAEWIDHTDWDGNWRFQWGSDLDSYECGTLPRCVTEWAGLQTDHLTINDCVNLNDDIQANYPNYYHSLVSLNDNAKFNFHQIADVIRRYF